MMIHSGRKRKTGVTIGDTKSMLLQHDKRGKHRKQAKSHCSVILLTEKACIDIDKKISFILT